MNEMGRRIRRRVTRLSGIVVPCAAIVLSAAAVAAQPSLGSAQNFAVLGATTVTNTGATIVTGNLGVSPGTAITGFPPGVVVGGTKEAGTMVAARAQADAGMAYAGLRAMACPPINNLSGRVLGTDVLSLPPGVYCFNSSAQLTGTLFLTGTGPWVFQIASTLTTASNARVALVNAGTTCGGSNVFWQVGSSATLGTDTQLIGNILATTSITMTTRASTSGSVVALAGAVTMDTNRASVCAGPIVPPPDDGDGDCDGHHHGDHDRCSCHKHGKDKGHDDCDDDHHGGKDHKDGDHDRDCDGHHGDKDHKDKDHNDKDHDKDRKDHDGKGRS